MGTIPCCTVTHYKVIRNDETMRGNSVSVYTPLESVGGDDVSVLCIGGGGGDCW